MDRPEDWRQERARVLAQARVVVVKVGSAVLTDAMGLSAAVLDSLAGQLAGLRRPPGSQAGQQANQSGERRLVLVSSGAVAAGPGTIDAGLGRGFSRPRHAHGPGAADP